MDPIFRYLHPPVRRNRGIVKGVTATDYRIVVATDKANLVCLNFAEDAAQSK